MDEFEILDSNNIAQKPAAAGGGGMGVSHSPLNLGAGGQSSPAAPDATSEYAPTAAPKSELVSWPDRITGVKHFFTKLHAGAIEFLDEQITAWLRDNPGVQIKRTNTTTGDVVGKKTEPNIIISVWY
jgi:hypothetical protein